jgi:hypothetical protein
MYCKSWADVLHELSWCTAIASTKLMSCKLWADVLKVMISSTAWTGLMYMHVLSWWRQGRRSKERKCSAASKAIATTVTARENSACATTTVCFQLNLQVTWRVLLIICWSTSIIIWSWLLIDSLWVSTCTYVYTYFSLHISVVCRQGKWCSANRHCDGRGLGQGDPRHQAKDLGLVAQAHAHGWIS